MMIYGLVLELRFKGSDYVARKKDINKLKSRKERNYYLSFKVRDWSGEYIINLPRVTDILHACYYIVNQVYFHHNQLEKDEVSLLDDGLRSLTFELENTFLEINSPIEQKNYTDSMKELIEVFIQTVKPINQFMEKEINSIIQSLEITLDYFSNWAMVYNAKKSYVIESHEDANIETF